MENASKALIIAGAILLAVLLLSIGITILNSTGAMQNEANQSVMNLEIQSFNEQFLKYQGTIVNASQVKSLLLLIKANNSYYEFDSSTPVGTDKYVTIIGNISSSSLYANKTYRVSAAEFNSNGYISTIRIELNN